MALTKSKLEANNRHLATHYEQIAVRSRKENRRNELLQLAANHKGVSKREFILYTLDRAIRAEGVTIKSLE